MVVLIFALLLIVTFGIVILVLRPTQKEKTLETRLDSIERGADGVIIEEAPADIVKRANLSDIPLVEVLLRRFAVAKTLQEYLSQADLDWSVGRVVAGTLFLLVAVPFVIGIFLPNLVVELVAGVIAASGIYLFIYVKRGMRFDRFNQLLPEGIDLLTRALKAGHSINAAIEMVSREIPEPVGLEFRRTFEEQNFGLPMREAMTNLAARVPIPDVQFLVTAILVQKETGGNLVEILEKTATVLRERLRLKGQLAIYTAQGRLTGWILAGLPFFLFIGLNILNPNYG
ncbi:MAG TPA: type II secretion system F family protein, partial [Nitrospira sp.]|nr:type II secretion system F family protein [Nitrospira sp.]